VVCGGAALISLAIACGLGRTDIANVLYGPITIWFCGLPVWRMALALMWPVAHVLLRRGCAGILVAAIMGSGVGFALGVTLLAVFLGPVFTPSGALTDLMFALLYWPDAYQAAPDEFHRKIRFAPLTPLFRGRVIGAAP